MRLATGDWLLAAVLLATLLMLLLLALVASAARRMDTGPGSKEAARAARGPGVRALRTSFRKAVRLIEQNLARRAERYSLSWTLVLDQDGQGGLPLREAGLRSALDADTGQAASSQGIAWHFFDKGVVVQLRTELLGCADDGTGDSAVWDAFLGLCRAYRPQRPFDAVVLALPAAALLDEGAAGQLALAARARAIHRRLWLAQNRLALRFPVHVVITACEQIPGFAGFGAALPDALRRSILGWASPHDVGAAYRSQWVDEALGEVTASAAGACAELCALEPGDRDSSAYLLLPNELARLRAGLTLFCDELMRPSAYHESFLLRGIYLTGDCDPAAAMQAEAVAPEPSARTRLPVFLRDIFERKVFPETGLVQASRQRLWQQGGGLLYWTGLALPVVWACGLVVATFQLHERGSALSAYLDEVGAASRADAAAGAGIRQRAIAALGGFESTGGARFYSPLMPGSWPVIDDLDRRLQDGLARAFARDALAALNEAVRTRTTLLTGVQADALGDMLTESGPCTLPAGWRTRVAAAPTNRNLEGLPEYGALRRYLDELDRLNAALGAMERLANPSTGPASGADLATAVRILLGERLPGTPQRTAALFRAAAQGRPLPAAGPIRKAAHCTLNKAGDEMYRRLFDNNGLLRTERAVDASILRLRDDARQDGDPGARLQRWQQLRAALDAQQAELGTGQGDWMRQRVLDLGAAQASLHKRIAAHPLLGAPAAAALRQRAEGRFAAFWSEWDAVVTGAEGGDAGAGLVQTDAGWDLSPERKALRDTITQMLSQPYLKPVAFAGLPAVPANATVRWERAGIERAAGLTEARKAFRSGPYPALPASLRTAAGTLVDLALAGQARAELVAAMTVTPPRPPDPTSDAERAAVVRVRAWLEEIGARDLCAELDAVLAQDALARLARLEVFFNAVEVYVPRDIAFRSWQGEKGAMSDAFGGGDADGVAAYVEQQQEFVNTIVEQAQGVLDELASSPLATQPLVTRWQALAADLRRYRLKSPTSSRLALENFILAGSAEIDIGNCVDKLGARAPAPRNGDLFGERLRRLQAGMLARCRELVAGDDQRRWQEFALAYNSELGRRAPFVMTSGAGAVDDAAADAAADPLVVPTPAPIPADRDAVDAVMKRYARARAASSLAARDPGQNGPAPEVRRADQQLRRVRDLMAPLYPAEEGQAAGLDVAVEFRANRAAESGASKIIDWSLRIGGATIHLGGSARTLRWEYGMPVLLSLRLARDGAVLPKAESGRPDMRVLQHTVSFQFDDPWALFSFINAYREQEAAGESGRGELLRFEFPLVAAAVPAPLAAETRAKVFVRLRVSAPGKQAALAWPAVFPAQVPLWQDPPKAPL